MQIGKQADCSSVALGQLGVQVPPGTLLSGVTGSAADSESAGPGSIPGRVVLEVENGNWNQPKESRLGKPAMAHADYLNELDERNLTD